MAPNDPWSIESLNNPLVTHEIEGHSMSMALNDLWTIRASRLLSIHDPKQPPIEQGPNPAKEIWLVRALRIFDWSMKGSEQRRDFWQSKATKAYHEEQKWKTKIKNSIMLKMLKGYNKVFMENKRHAKKKYNCSWALEPTSPISMINSCISFFKDARRERSRFG